MATHSNETGKSFLASLQAMRFLAAAMVLISHLLLEANNKSFSSGARLVDPTETRWDAGVDIFFVISGFIMYYIMRDSFHQKGKPLYFLKNRFIRVVPLYWTFTSAFILINILAPSTVKNNDISFIRTITTYSMISWPKFDGSFKPILGVGWTLNCEIFFYIIFSVALIFKKSRGMIFISSTLLIIGFIGILIGADEPFSPFYYFYFSPIFIEFLFGIFIAHLYVSGTRLNWAIRALLIVGGFVSLALFLRAGLVKYPDLRFLHGGLPAALIVAGGVLGTDLKSSSIGARLAVLGGDVSYSLYLSHLFSLRILKLIWTRFAMPTDGFFLAVAFIFALAGAYLAFRFIEQPMLIFLRSITRQRGAKRVVI